MQPDNPSPPRSRRQTAPASFPMASLDTDFFQHEAGPLTIRLAGRLDGNSAPAFGRRLAEHLSATATGVVLDASGLEFISSAGLRELMTLAKKLRQNQAKAVLAGVTPLVNEVLEISGMNPLFLHAADQTEALRRLADNSDGPPDRLFAGGAKA